MFLRRFTRAMCRRTQKASLCFVSIRMNQAERSIIGGTYNIGPGARQPNSGAAGSASLLQGINDFSVRGYRGTCPPRGACPHRYHFDVLALSVDEIGLEPGPSCRAIEEAARRHCIAQARLTGMFDR